MPDDAEIWFYHLERSSLEDVLPMLLEKTRERGWHALVRAADPALVQRLDERLWSYRPDSFLAHGRDGDENPDRQPIWLTTSAENPNAAQALFIVDHADLGETKGFQRCFIIFDGTDDTALQQARGRWKTLKDAGVKPAYWRQSAEGRWEQAA